MSKAIIVILPFLRDAGLYMAGLTSPSVNQFECGVLVSDENRK